MNAILRLEKPAAQKPEGKDPAASTPAAADAVQS